MFSRGGAAPGVPIVWWGPVGWGLIVVEILWLLLLWSVRPGRDQAALYLQFRGRLLGLEELSAGPVTHLIAVNLLVVVALWAAHRGARFSTGREARVMGVTALAVALVFAYISWSAFRLARSSPPMRAHEVLVRTPGGGYETRPP